ncbi:MAG: hypothetical protein Unbinned400contig1002_7 [Prokaryotic dsDNA virus sp.]|nr:MAG: hypothetical protein Unbinned400contig1002_7 [Prokaryotic dsDNA virus sp.]|tara:strand:+ start:2040 stop:2303 length:264 start_codon:yes stop_codon:yes gene_type:complete
MGDVNTKSPNFIISVSPREFALITKALCGTLDLQSYPDEERDDKKDAMKLGTQLLIRNIQVKERNLEKAQHCYSNMISQTEANNAKE